MVQFNLHQVVLNARELVELWVGGGMWSSTFMAKVGVGLGVVFFIGKVLNSLIGGSDRGMMMTFMGLMLPVVVGLVGYGFVFENVANWVPDGTMYRAISLGSGAIAGVMVLVFVSPLFLGGGIGRSIGVFVVTMVLAFGSMHFLEYGLDRIQGMREGVGQANQTYQGREE